jgi:predicted ribosomally synthesized peptide with nif11-like leader
MSLQQLDAFLAHARRSPALKELLASPLELAEFLALARGEGFTVEEADVLEARERDEAKLSAAELQERAGVDARRLRSFIHS